MFSSHYLAASVLSHTGPSANVSPTTVVTAGTAGPDLIHGSELADTLSGDAGNDTLYGYGGNDILNGGMGNDELWGGDGDDELWDAMGIDKLYGGNGNDRLQGAIGSWHWPSPVSEMPYLLLDGGAGNDFLQGANLYNFMGGSGDDRIIVEVSGNAQTHSVVDGGDGADRLDFTIRFRAEGQLSVTGGAGADTYYLTAQNSTQDILARIRITDFAAGEGGDQIAVSGMPPVGQNGNPFASGLLRLVGSGANTLLQAKQSWPPDTYVTLLELVGIQPSQLSSANFVGGVDPHGGSTSVTLSGTAQDDVLAGGPLDDILSGQDGNDTLLGHGGNDRLDGGSGDDHLEGGGGNDFLQGGAGNDKVVDYDGGSNELYGGEGNDYLEVRSPDSNLLDGGPGDDQLFGQNGNFVLPTGQYTLRGGAGNDYLFAYRGAILEGGDGNDYLASGNGLASLYGGSGNDVLRAYDGASDMLYGGAGIDRAQFSNSSADYILKPNLPGFTVTHKESGSIDYLDGIERLQFRDLTIALDLDGTAGQTFRIYRAAFDRAPDASGMGFWLSRMDRGSTLVEIAAGFAASKEFADLYGSTPSNTELVTRMYKNILHRDPEPGGYAFWLDALDSRKAELPTVLAAISESAENKAAVAELIANGISYTPYAG